MKAVVAAFNQEKALVGAFSVITNLRMELFEALHIYINYHQLPSSPGTADLEVSQQRRQCCRRDLEPGDAAVAGQQVVAEVLQGAATGHPGVGEHVEIPPVNSLKQYTWSFKPQAPMFPSSSSF